MSVFSSPPEGFSWMRLKYQTVKHTEWSDKVIMGKMITQRSDKVIVKTKLSNKLIKVIVRLIKQMIRQMIKVMQMIRQTFWNKK